VYVGKLDEIYIFPMKACKPKSVTCAYFEQIGLTSGPFLDRGFGLIDETGKLAYNGSCPKAILIDVTYERGQFVFLPPNFGKNLEPLIINNEDLEFDEEKLVDCKWELEINFKLLHLGAHYDDWINQILQPTNGKTYRLVYHYKKSTIRGTRKDYIKAYPETWKKTDFSTCSFSTAATIITWPSIEDVNEKMSKEYNHLRYRCNFVVDPVDNTPYQEDSWRKIRIGNTVELHYNKPCTKCGTINVDPETGAKDPNHEPLKSLTKFRKVDHGSDPETAPLRKKLAMGPPLSINCSVDVQGYVQVGDPIYVYR
jgi:uncharacterized protein YcbX